MFEFAVGARVEKTDGYPFVGVVRAAFKNKKGADRYVVENLDGLMHIFNGVQIKSRPERRRFVISCGRHSYIQTMDLEKECAQFYHVFENQTVISWEDWIRPLNNLSENDIQQLNNHLLKVLVSIIKNNSPSIYEALKHYSTDHCTYSFEEF